MVGADEYTLIEWSLDGSAPYENSGTGGSLPLLPGGTVPDVFAGYPALFWKGALNTTTDSCLCSESTSIKPPGELTASIWVNFRDMLVDTNIFNKEYRSDGTHTTPFSAFCIGLDSNYGEWFVSVAVGGQVHKLTLSTAPAFLVTNKWYLFALTYKDGLLSAYLDGYLCGTLAIDGGGAIDYGTNGPYGVMGYAQGTTNGSSGAACMARIESVARSAAYLLSYYKQGVGLRDSGTAASLGGGFTDVPTAISGLLAWYDATDGLVTSGGSVSIAYDKSGNGLHASTSVLARRPTLNTTFNTNKRSMSCSGSNALHVRGINHHGPHTIIAVHKGDGGALRTLLSCNQAASQDYIQFNGAYITLNGDAATSIASTAASITSFVNNGANSLIRHHGKTLEGIPAATTTTLDAITLGAMQANASNGYVGDIAEVLVYNRALTSQELVTIELYLAAKWGLSATPIAFTRLWDFNASLGVTLGSGTLVAGWSDQSGNGRNVAQVDPSAQPELTANWHNSQPAIHFVNDPYFPRFIGSALPFTPLNTPYTLLFIGEWAGTGPSNNVMFNGNDIGTESSLFFNGTDNLSITSGSTGDYSVPLVGQAIATHNPICVVARITNPGALFVDGAQRVLSSGSANFSQALDRINFGAWDDSLSYPFVGYIARAVAFQGALTDAEIHKLSLWANLAYSL